MKHLLLIPLLPVAVALLFAILLVVGTLHLLFNATHLHWLAENTTDPVLDQLIRLGEWGRRKVQENS